MESFDFNLRPSYTEGSLLDLRRRGGRTRATSRDNGAAAHRKRTLVTAGLIFAVFPALIALGVVLLRDRSYMLISWIILALTIAMAVMTVWSGAKYLWGYRDVITSGGM